MFKCLQTDPPNQEHKSRLVWTTNNIKATYFFHCSISASSVLEVVTVDTFFSQY